MLREEVRDEVRLRVAEIYKRIPVQQIPEQLRTTSWAADDEEGSRIWLHDVRQTETILFILKVSTNLAFSNGITLSRRFMTSKASITGRSYNDFPLLLRRRMAGGRLALGHRLGRIGLGVRSCIVT